MCGWCGGCGGNRVATKGTVKGILVCATLPPMKYAAKACCRQNVSLETNANQEAIDHMSICNPEVCCKSSASDQCAIK